MRLLTSRDAIEEAQKRFSSLIETEGVLTPTVSIGYQSGQFATRVYWLERLGFWAYFGFPPSEKSKGNRYWNVFGIGKPSGLVSISCEINPPLEGVNRQAAGLFFEASDSSLHLGHRGIVNARGRVDKNFVFSNSRGHQVVIDDSGQKSAIFDIGSLQDSQFPVSLAEFVREIARVKELARSRR
jgi:hypothetical protein